MKLNFLFGMNLFIKIFVMSDTENVYTWKIYEEAWITMLRTYQDRNEIDLIPKLNTYEALTYLQEDVKKL